MSLVEPRSGTRHPNVLEARVRALVEEIRDSVAGYVFDPKPASITSVTELLSAAPVVPCRALVELWRSAGPKADVVLRQLSHEERLVLELVLGMYDWSEGSNTYSALPPG